MLLKCFLFMLFSLQVFADEACDLKKMRWLGMPFDAEGRFHHECRPQILYSWVTSPEIIDTNDAGWPLRRGRAFFFRSPLGSSMYGTFSYRVKIKPDVNFKLVPWDRNHYYCRHPKKEKRKTIYVNHDPRIGFSEYVICSEAVIESWSFGMKEHLEEMLQEYALIQKLGPKRIDGFLNPNVSESFYPKSFLGYNIHDRRNNASRKTIEAHIELMKSWVEAGRGRVFQLSEGLAEEEHFKTRLVLPYHKVTNDTVSGQL